MLYLGIILTIITGLFFLIGIIILKNDKHKDRTSLFTISLAFVVLIGLLFFDLLPEILETKNIYMLIPMFIGFFLLVLLDKLIPHHHHEHRDNHCDKKDHKEHLNHIGIVTIISLAIHNMIEGLSLYSVALNSVKSGVLMMIAISLHNIPLGFQIGNSLLNKKYSKLLIFFLCISSFLGALIFILFGSLNEFVITILLSLTFGMLLYLLVFELLGEIKSSLTKKETIYGLILGVVILIITFII
jgi:ZIP family zinc transporter